MRRSTVQAIALAVLPIASSQARLLYSGPEDLYAFPKYRLTFLNDLPVLNETAQRWLQHGLQGGQREFLGESWNEPMYHSQAAMREIGSSDPESPQEAPKVSQSDTLNHSLEHMRLGPDNAFMCLIPPARDRDASAPDDLDGDEMLRNSWSLLRPLSGKCLYHRQSWFTYSYCHDQEIRQFKELPLTHAPIGPYEPAEDTQWESFTLGRAPGTPESREDVVVTDQLAPTTTLEVAHGPGARYLVQRWGDGTFCEKTMKPREVEVQFHCSMTMTDSILLVREAKTCSYVTRGANSAVIRDESLIRCREIIDPVSDPVPPSESTQLEERQADEDLSSNESDHPLHLSNRTSRFVIPSPALLQSSLGVGSSETDDPWDDIWKRIMDALKKEPEMQALTGNNQQVFLDRGENGEVFIEILEEISMDSSPDEAAQGGVTPEEFARLTDVIRKAVSDVKGGAEPEEENSNEEGGNERDRSHNTRDEL
ncbi:hypothetical protein BU15DRAFT_70301 [Melanogaster broomeanus]|nr:hypothetical protein BU15DRAFT_70301 [Melanogaster broomeanus]